MKNTDTFEEKDKTDLRFWDDSDERLGVNRPKDHCSCSGGGLVKYYPPLLTLSTVMAGVFCWLYVTKPVMVTRSMAPVAEVATSLLVSGEPDQNGDIFVQAPDSAVVPAFDPGLGFLPGEEVSGEVQFAENVPGQDLQPVRIKRSARPLFEPLPPEEVAEAAEVAEVAEVVEVVEVVEVAEVERVLVAEKAIVIGERHPVGGEQLGDEGTGEGSSGLHGGEEVEASTEAIPTDASVDLEFWPEGGTHEIAISLMGELVADADRDEAVIALSFDD